MGMIWQTIEWTESTSLVKDEFDDYILGKTGKNLPQNNRDDFEYIICLSNGNHYLAKYEGIGECGWFYVEDMPAQYPIGWSILFKYM